MMAWLASWMLNPLMLGIGALAMASPLIIHLLNRRRFKIVDWAAMAFLLDADKKNRKRVRLENLILLLLRCLAMLLLGLMLARPFFPSDLARLLGNEQRFERVVVLDDSLSQKVVTNNQTRFDVAKQGLADLLNQIARDDNEDYFTLFVTSQPDRPLLTFEPVTPDTVPALLQTLDELNGSDQRADYQAGLQEVRQYLNSASGDRRDINRLLFVLSDMRQVDWRRPEAGDSETAPHKLLAAISEEIAQTNLIDTGVDIPANLALLEVKAEDLLVANTIIRFTAKVANFGNSTANDVQVRFREGESPPLTETIARIPPGETRNVTFRYFFQRTADAPPQDDLEATLQSNRLSFQITCELVSDASRPDYLALDDKHYYAAHVMRGLPVLVVDGEPSPIPERGESYYLGKIGVPGTGMLVDTITVSELEMVSLSKYQVIFLCNIGEASASRIDTLQQWVADGGGLVLMPGGVVRATAFNDSFYRDGDGLSPVRLVSEAGDPTMAQWVNFEIVDPGYPPLQVAQDRDVDLNKVEIFSWWDTEVAPQQLGSVVAVPLRFTNADRSPALAEKTLGDGKVIAFSIPADADWTMWPAHPTYLPVMWDLVNYLVAGEPQLSSTVVGNDLNYPVDLSRYDSRVGLRDPQSDKIEGTAEPVQANSVLYRVTFENLSTPGFYELDLRHNRDDGTDTVAIAANVDTRDSDLTKLDWMALEEGFFGTQTRLASIGELTGEVQSASTSGIWPMLLVGLAGVLGLEQFLGWWFGRKR